MAIQSVALTKQERNLIKRINIGSVAANVLAEVLLTVCLLANLISTDATVELGWMRAQMVVVLISFALSCCLSTNSKFLVP